MRHAGHCVLGLGTLLLLAGCQRVLNDERRVEVKGAEVKTVLYDVQQKEKTVQILIQSETVPVDAYLVLDKDLTPFVEQLGKSEKPVGALGSSLRSKDISLQGRIPAKSAFAVVLTSPKDATVTIKTTETR